MPVVNKYKSETLQLLIHLFYGSFGHLWHICEGFSFLWSVLSVKTGVLVFLSHVVQVRWGCI